MESRLTYPNVSNCLICQNQSHARKTSTFSTKTRYKHLLLSLRTKCTINFQNRRKHLKSQKLHYCINKNRKLEKQEKNHQLIKISFLITFINKFLGPHTVFLYFVAGLSLLNFYNTKRLTWREKIAFDFSFIFFSRKTRHTSKLLKALLANWDVVGCCFGSLV